MRSLRRLCLLLVHSLVRSQATPNAPSKRCWSKRKNALENKAKKRCLKIAFIVLVLSLLSLAACWCLCIRDYRLHCSVFGVCFGAPILWAKKFFASFFNFSFNELIYACMCAFLAISHRSTLLRCRCRCRIGAGIFWLPFVRRCRAFAHFAMRWQWQCVDARRVPFGWFFFGVDVVGGVACVPSTEEFT